MLSVWVSDPHQGEVTRQFYLHLPAAYELTNTLPVPLVLDYHWWGGSATSQVSDYPWPLLADTDSTPFIYLALQVTSVFTGFITTTALKIQKISQNYCKKVKSGIGFRL